MDVEDVYSLWNLISQMIHTKDKEQCIEQFVSYLYEHDFCDLVSLLDYAIAEEEDDTFIKVLRIFCKENELFEDEEEEY